MYANISIPSNAIMKTNMNSSKLKFLISLRPAIKSDKFFQKSFHSLVNFMILRRRIALKALRIPFSSSQFIPPEMLIVKSVKLTMTITASNTLYLSFLQFLKPRPINFMIISIVNAQTKMISKISRAFAYCSGQSNLQRARVIVFARIRLQIRKLKVTLFTTLQKKPQTLFDFEREITSSSP